MKMKNSTDKNKEYEASLKSLETENYLDQRFYRPIGFRIARSLRNTGITPNQITVLSIFVGAAAGPLFYPDNLKLNILGIICLIIANILDCVDGQLARLTGIKSKIGRILDGLAGDIWFILIYTFLALRLKNEYGSYLFFIPAILSGLSHLVQANITDYYKTLHLYFVSKEKGKEFQRLDEVRAQHKAMKGGLSKALFFLYTLYTLLQEKTTPMLQDMLWTLKFEFGDDIPENIRLDFRSKSIKLMKHYIDFMTFNGRTFFLFIAILSGYVSLYFLFEIIVLNTILIVSIHKHEQICESIIKSID
jgi:phosphatidylglycerophosphate synthase